MKRWLACLVNYIETATKDYHLHISFWRFRKSILHLFGIIRTFRTYKMIQPFRFFNGHTNTSRMIPGKKEIQRINSQGAYNQRLHEQFLYLHSMIRQKRRNTASSPRMSSVVEENKKLRRHYTRGGTKILSSDIPFLLIHQ